MPPWHRGGHIVEFNKTSFKLNDALHMPATATAVKQTKTIALYSVTKLHALTQ